MVKRPAPFKFSSGDCNGTTNYQQDEEKDTRKKGKYPKDTTSSANNVRPP